MVAPLIGLAAKEAAKIAAKKAAKKVATEAGESALDKVFLGGLGAMGAASAIPLGKEIRDRYEGGSNSYESRLNAQQRANEEVEKDKREAEAEIRREARGHKKGGTVKSASKRADGIAQRGKTKGRYI